MFISFYNDSFPVATTSFLGLIYITLFPYFFQQIIINVMVRSPLSTPNKCWARDTGSGIYTYRSRFVGLKLFQAINICLFNTDGGLSGHMNLFEVIVNKPRW